MYDIPDDARKITPRIQRRLEQLEASKLMIARLRAACAVPSDGESVFYIVRHRGALPWEIMADMAQADIGVFCPVEKVQRRKGKSGKVAVTTKPKYPGYFFVQLPLGSDAAILGVLSFDGVTGLMGRAGVPSPIALELMQKIRTPVHMKRATLRMLFSVGEAVEITNGGFHGFAGRVVAPPDKHGDVRIEVDLFNGLVPISLHVDSVRKV